MDGNYGNGFNQDPNNGWNDNGYNNGNNNGWNDGNNNGYSNNDMYANNYDANQNQQFINQTPDKDTVELFTGKTSLTCGILALVVSIFCLIVNIFLGRIYYALNICAPIVSIYGIISGVKCLKNDRGVAKAWIGLIVSIISVVPAIICFLIFILDMAACFIK